jgi:hypothetical protein
MVRILTCPVLDMWSILLTFTDLMAVPMPPLSIVRYFTQLLERSAVVRGGGLLELPLDRAGALIVPTSM